MAQWSELGRLNTDGLKNILQYYQMKNFPIYVRHKFASYIEQVFNEISREPNKQNNPATIKTFIRNLRAQIEFLIGNNGDEDGFLSSASEVFKVSFSKNELAIFRALESCLQWERKVLNAKNELLSLNLRLQNISEAVCNFSSQFKARQSIMHGRNFYIRNEVLTMIQWIVRHDINSSITLPAITADVVNKIIEWKNNQRKIATGAIEIVSIEDIQNLCEQLAEILWTLYGHISIAERIALKNRYCNKSAIVNLKSSISALLEGLFTNALVVEKHTKQVLLKTSWINDEVVIRHLCAHKILNHSQEFAVVMKMADPFTVKELRTAVRKGCQSTGNVDISSMVEMVDGECNFRYNETSKCFSASCSGFKIGKNFKRISKNSKSEKVTEEKRYFYFETNLPFDQRQLKVWTISLPIVVRAAGTQDTDSWGAIFGENNFGKNIKGEPFHVEKSIPISELFEALDQFFYFRTGRNLSETHKDVLKEKLFSTQRHHNSLRSKLKSFQQPPTTSDNVLWEDFWGNNMPGYEFSFWTWFYEIVVMSETCLKGIWSNNWKGFLGFFNRDEAEDLLKDSLPGVFVLRFSDSMPGGISIVFVQKDGDVGHVYPLDRKLLAYDMGPKNIQCAFAERIMGDDQLQKMHPDTCKEECFGKYNVQDKSVPKRMYIPWDKKIGGCESTQQNGECSSDSLKNNSESPTDCSSKPSSPGDPFGKTPSLESLFAQQSLSESANVVVCSGASSNTTALSGGSSLEAFSYHSSDMKSLLGEFLHSPAFSYESANVAPVSGVSSYGTACSDGSENMAPYSWDSANVAPFSYGSPSVTPFLDASAGAFFSEPTLPEFSGVFSSVTPFHQCESSNVSEFWGESSNVSEFWDESSNASEFWGESSNVSEFWGDPSNVSQFFGEFSNVAPFSDGSANVAPLSSGSVNSFSDESSNVAPLPGESAFVGALLGESTAPFVSTFAKFTLNAPSQNEFLNCEAIHLNPNGNHQSEPERFWA